MSYRRINRRDIEIMISDLLETMRSDGTVGIDHSGVILRLCRKLGVDNLSMVNAAPHNFKELRDLKMTQVYIITFLNCYRHEMLMGTLNDCLRNMLSDAASNNITLKQYDRFEDFGLGPICKQNEIIRIFPGAANIEIGDPPPSYTYSDLVMCFGDARRNYHKGQVSFDDIEEFFEHKFGDKVTDACVFIEKRKEAGAGSQISRVFRFLRTVVDARDDAMNQLSKRQLNLIRKEYDEQVLKITPEDISNFEITLKNETQAATGLLQSLIGHFPRKWTEADNAKTARKLSSQLRHFFPGSPIVLTNAVIEALTLAIQKPSPEMCEKCNLPCDTCRKCTIPSSSGAAGFKSEFAEAEFEEVDVSDIIETLNSIDLSLVTSPSLLEKLHDIETSCCSILRVPFFEKLGHSSFLSFLCNNSSEISADLRSLISSTGDVTPAVDDMPKKSELLQTMIESLQKKGAFVTSWRTLVDLRKATLAKYQVTNWDAICDVTFDTFMMRNTAAFAEKGFTFISGNFGSKQEGTASMKTSLEEAAATLVVFLDSVASTQTAVEEAALLRRQFVMSESDLKVLDGCNIRASLKTRIGEPSIEAGKRIMIFPTLTDLTDSFTCEQQHQQSEPLELLEDIISNPVGKDIELLMQWTDRFSSEYGQLDRFLIDNVKDEKRVLVSSENGGVKYYPVAQIDSERLESAIISREFPAIAVQLWSHIAAGEVDNEMNAIDAAVSQLVDALTEKSQRHDLLDTIIIMILSTPVSIVRQFFDLLLPVLERVSRPLSRLWCDLGRVSSRHPQRDLITERINQLDNSIKDSWLNIMDHSRWEFPHYHQSVVTKTVTEVKEIIKLDQNGEAALQEETVVSLTPINDSELDTIEQRVIEDIRRGRNYGINNPVTNIVRKSVSVLSDELYENKFHFLFELLQNADDCSYAESTIPCINVNLTTDGIELLCNEVGFGEKNVRAICDINQSTKTANDASIGRKGIGFKAVFKITNCPHITSNGYDFYFDRHACDLGLILPIQWNGETDIPSTGRLLSKEEVTDHLSDDEWITRLHLPFRPDLQQEEFLQECSDSALVIEPVLLLFLNKLRRVMICDSINPQARVLNRYDANDPLPDLSPDMNRVLLTEDIDGTRSEQLFLVYRKKHEVPSHIDIPSKDGAKSTVFQVAFEVPDMPGDTIDSLELPIHPVTAYLPTNTRIFRFVLQADWSVNAARDRIVEDVKWNKYLRTIAASHIVEGLMQLKETNMVPPQYLLAALQTHELQQSDWFRTVQVGMFEGIKKHNYIFISSANEWVLPSDCLMIPPNLYDIVRKMISQELLLRVSGLYFTDPYVFENYKSIATRLGVKVLTAGSFLSIVEKISSDSETDSLLDDFEWLSGLYSVIKVLLKDVRKNATGSESETRLLERFRKVRCIPTQFGRLAAADNTIMWIQQTSNDTLQTYSFFKKFKAVDSEFIRSCRGSLTEAELGILLHNKLGVKATEPKVILQSLQDDIIANWREDPPSAEDVISSFLWICERFSRELRSKNRTQAKEVLEQMPIVCKFTSTAKPPSYYQLEKLVAVKNSDELFLVDSSEVYVLQEEFNFPNIPTIGWLVPHSDYKPVSSLLGIAGIFKDVGGHMQVRNVPLNISKVDPKIALTFPPAQDDGYEIEADYLFPGLQILLEHLTNLHNEYKNTPGYYKGIVGTMQMIIEVVHESTLESKVTYLPDYSKAEGFQGRVATEKERRASESKFPVTTISGILRGTPWLVGRNYELVKPCNAILCSEENIQLVGRNENNLIQIGGGGGLLTALGIPQVLEKSQLVDIVRKWQSGPYECEISRMIRVLKVLGSEMELIWMPKERGLLLAETEREVQSIPGLWYSPTVCFTKGGTHAFLDLANGEYRFCGYIYMYCGFELGANSVKEHAPWAVQLRNVEDICKRGIDKRQEVMELLHEISKYQEEIDPEGWEALKTLNVWRTSDGSFVNPSTSQLLVADFEVDALMTIPEGYCVLDKTLKEVQSLAIKSGARPFDDVAKTETTVIPISQTVDDFHLIKSAFLTFVWQVMMWQSEVLVDENNFTLSDSVPSGVTCGTLVVKPCQGISFERTLDSKKIQKNSSEDEMRDTHYDRKSNTFYVAVVNDHSRLIRSITRDVCKLLVLPESIEKQLQNKHWKSLIELYNDFIEDKIAVNYFDFVRQLDNYFVEMDFSKYDLRWFKTTSPSAYFRNDVRHVMGTRSLENIDIYSWFSFKLCFHLLESYLNVSDDVMDRIRDIPLELASRITSELLHTETAATKLNAHVLDSNGKLSMLYSDTCVSDGPDCVSDLTYGMLSTIINKFDINMSVSGSDISNVIKTCLSNANRSIPKVAADIERDVRQAIRIVGKKSSNVSNDLEKQLEDLAIPENFEIFFETTAQAIKKREERKAKQAAQREQSEQQEQETSEQNTERRPPLEPSAYDPTAPNWGSAIRRNQHDHPNTQTEHSAETIQASIDAKANWPAPDEPSIIKLEKGKTFENQTDEVFDGDQPPSLLPTLPPSLRNQFIFVGGEKYGGSNGQGVPSPSHTKVFKMSDEPSNAAIGKWGEERMISFLKENPLLDNTGREIEEIHWVNQDSEQFYPFDIIGGCTVEELLKAVPSPKTDDYNELINRFPNFVAIEVKTSIIPNRLDLEISASELMAASKLRFRFSIYALSDACQEPRLLKIPDPYTLIENNKLQLRLLVATEGDDGTAVPADTNIE